MMIPNSGGGNRIYSQLSPKEVADLGGMEEFHSTEPENRPMKSEWKDTAMLDILQTRFKDILKPYTGSVKKLLLDQSVSHQTAGHRGILRPRQGLRYGRCLTYT